MPEGGAAHRRRGRRRHPVPAISRRRGDRGGRTRHPAALRRCLTGRRTPFVRISSHTSHVCGFKSLVSAWLERLNQLIAELHLPAVWDVNTPGIGVIACEPAVRFPEPIREGAVVSPPRNVVATVAIEIACRDNLPAGWKHRPGVGVVAGEASARLTEPVR